jgi:hypothetical protein
VVSLARRRLLLGGAGSYVFSVAGFINPASTLPSSTFALSTYTTGLGAMIQTLTLSLLVTNTNPGTIATGTISTEIITLNTQTPFKVTFTPLNYVQNMEILVTVPVGVVFPSSGTNTCSNINNMATTSFNCVYASTPRTITISGQMTGATSPGTICFTLNNLSTPSVYGTTTSFSIQTQHLSGGNYY